MEIKIIGVAGAGTMGNGIAQVAAEAGFQVIMRDLEEQFIQRGLAAVEKNLGRAVEKGRRARLKPIPSAAASGHNPSKILTRPTLSLKGN